VSQVEIPRGTREGGILHLRFWFVGFLVRGNRPVGSVSAGPYGGKIVVSLRKFLANGVTLALEL
jgi:hypothetical protein